jgi:integrase
MVADALVERHIDEPGRLVVSMYLSTLESSQSRASMEASLVAVARLVAALSGLDEIDPDGPVRSGQVDWARLDYRSAAALRAAMRDRWAPATINRHVAAVRGVVKVCKLSGLMEPSRADAVREALQPAKAAYRGEDPTARLVTDAELRSIFDALASIAGAGARRDAAMVAILAMGALRRGELVGLDLADWNPQTQELMVRHGKGGKRRKVWLHGGAAAAVADWVAVRGSDPGPLLLAVNRGGHVRLDRHDPDLSRLTTHAVWRRIRMLADRSAVATFAPHDLRRKVATDLLDGGDDVVAVAKLLGHANVATTARYDRRGESAARKASAHIRLPYVAPRA